MVQLTLRLASVLALVAAARAQDEAQHQRVHRDPSCGFQIELPPGWTCAVTARTDAQLSMTITPEGAPAHLSATLTSARGVDVLEPDDVARLALATVEAQEMYTDGVLDAFDLAGRSSPRSRSSARSTRSRRCATTADSSPTCARRAASSARARRRAPRRAARCARSRWCAAGASPRRN
jgi:hypothetical protein